MKNEIEILAIQEYEPSKMQGSENTSIPIQEPRISHFVEHYWLSFFFFS